MLSCDITTRYLKKISFRWFCREFRERRKQNAIKNELNQHNHRVKKSRRVRTQHTFYPCPPPSAADAFGDSDSDDEFVDYNAVSTACHFVSTIFNCCMQFLFCCWFCTFKIFFNSLWSLFLTDLLVHLKYCAPFNWISSGMHFTFDQLIAISSCCYGYRLHTINPNWPQAIMWARC